MYRSILDKNQKQHPVKAVLEMDPSNEIKRTIEKSRHSKALYLATIVQLNGAHESMKQLLMTPVSKECGIIQLEVSRNASGFNAFNPKYVLTLVLIDAGGSTTRQDLMVAKKKLVNRTSNYILSTDIKNPRSKGPAYFGKLRSSTTKKDEYFLFGPGENPARVKVGQEARKTFLMTKFEDANIEGIGKFKKTRCFLPYFSSEQNIKNYSGVEDPHDLGISKAVHALKNKRPKWSKSKNKYVFKFGARVKDASCKNTQLIEDFRYDPDTMDTEENAEEVSLTKDNIVFQFGKYDKNTFSLDVQAPVSIYQAFGLSLAI